MKDRRAYHNQEPRSLPAQAPIEAVKSAFGARLQKLRVAKGWNQTELAKFAAPFTSQRKFGRDNISCYERGVTLPGPKHLHALARALGVQETDLLPSRGMPSSETGNAAPLDVRETRDGFAWLKVNQEVSWGIVVQILELLRRPGASQQESSQRA